MNENDPVLRVEPATAIGAAVPWFREKLAALGHVLNPCSALASELKLLEAYRAASLRQDVVKYRNAADWRRKTDRHRRLSPSIGVVF